MVQQQQETIVQLSTAVLLLVIDMALAQLEISMSRHMAAAAAGIAGQALAAAETEMMAVTTVMTDLVAGSSRWDLQESRHLAGACSSSSSVVDMVVLEGPLAASSSSSSMAGVLLMTHMEAQVPVMLLLLLLAVAVMHQVLDIQEGQQQGLVVLADIMGQLGTALQAWVQDVLVVQQLAVLLLLLLLLLPPLLLLPLLLRTVNFALL
jgi:hypothetical protein